MNAEEIWKKSATSSHLSKIILGLASSSKSVVVHKQIMTICLLCVWLLSLCYVFLCTREERKSAFSLRTQANGPTVGFSFGLPCFFCFLFPLQPLVSCLVILSPLTLQQAKRTSTFHFCLLLTSSSLFPKKQHTIPNHSYPRASDDHLGVHSLILNRN